MSIFWFSQTIGPGRGLELLAQAADFLTDLPIEFHFRGTARENYEIELCKCFPKAFQNHVHFHSRVPHAELLSGIAEHDLGYAAEECYCASRELTITNKILQYLLGGLPVLASNTQGQVEVADSAPEAIFIFEQGDAGELAAGIRNYADNPEFLKAAKDAALRAAEERFCWENSAPVLVEKMAAALKTKS